MTKPLRCLALWTLLASASSGASSAQPSPPVAKQGCYVPASGTVYAFGIGNNTPTSCLQNHQVFSFGFGLPLSQLFNSGTPILDITNQGASVTAVFTNSGAAGASALEARATSGGYAARFFNAGGTAGAIFGESSGSAPTLQVLNRNKQAVGAVVAESEGTVATATFINRGLHGPTAGGALYAEGHGQGTVMAVTNINTGPALHAGGQTTTGHGLVFFANRGDGPALVAQGWGAQGGAHFWSFGTGPAIQTHGPVVFLGDLDVNGAIRVRGQNVKNAIVPTSQGDTEVYSEESSEVWFTDYGSGRVVDGQAWVPIDPLFAETVSLQHSYHVFLQAYSQGDLYVSERRRNGFRVRLTQGPRNAEFSYRLVAKRKGFEQRRLKPVSKP